MTSDRTNSPTPAVSHHSTGRWVAAVNLPGYEAQILQRRWPGCPDWAREEATGNLCFGKQIQASEKSQLAQLPVQAEPALKDEVKRRCQVHGGCKSGQGFRSSSGEDSQSRSPRLPVQMALPRLGFGLVLQSQMTSWSVGRSCKSQHLATTNPSAFNEAALN